MVVRPTKKPQYKTISSPHPLLLHLHSPHSLLHLHSPYPLLHLYFDPSPILALPRAPCIVIVDNAPWRLDGFGHPSVCIWFQLVLGLVSVLFILGISSLQHMSYFGRSHFNASKFAVLSAPQFESPRCIRICSKITHKYAQNTRMVHRYIIKGSELYWYLEIGSYNHGPKGHDLRLTYLVKYYSHEMALFLVVSRAVLL